MDIGTAKPTAQELAQVPHHLIDIIDPGMTYSVSQFRNDAERLIADILSRNKLPVLVGGTMMYYNALVKGLSTLPASNACVRAEIEEQGTEKGWPHMHAQLTVIDPVCAARIHPNDPQRITRALEVYQLSGRPLSVLQQESSGPNPVLCCSICDCSTRKKRIARKDRVAFYTDVRTRFRRRGQTINRTW